ncbi:MAG: Glu-tRNA(Gln) amidotransferase subunit GatE [Candidatus Thermoplasmatota archaeon]|nr:Glu-tRNA(Gln) amidotransferase subunit GatE [Candidatus Thermoplasmatota archaeon]
MSEVDYRTLGLRVGLEIHQQLNTGKLFCDCDSTLVDDHRQEFVRMLRPTQSEMGEIDRAALEEAERKLQFRYQSVSCSCLVEADEEPPHDANKVAIGAAMEMTLLLNATPVDEIHFMRKIVIDGSNTCGFQRTALVATDGLLEMSGNKISILSVCLEEDAARKISEQGSEVTYRLDRLGIPLIEIATGPDISTPEETRQVALRLGSLLRATRKVRRGIGTIREDLNVSISGGARVEIKGAQELKLLPVYVEEEVKRQLALLEVKDLLRRRGAGKASAEVTDLTQLLVGSKCGVIASAIGSGGKVLTVKLPKFANTLSRTGDGVGRLGAELAAHARVSGVKGLFHSDELPGYGITDKEVELIKGALKMGEEDAFVLIADDAERAHAALVRVVDRANAGLDGVPEETRDPLPDGKSVYSRPLPGKDRMYPETDVRPIRADDDVLESIRLNMPELPEETVARFVKDFGLSKSQADALMNAGYDDEFELLAKSLGNPQVVARVYLHAFPELEKAGLSIARLDVELLRAFMTQFREGAFAKEAVPELLAWMVRNGSYDVSKAIEHTGVGTVDKETLDSLCERIVTEREEFIRERGAASLGPLMGVVMKELRGKVDGQVISEALKEKIKRLLS